MKQLNLAQTAILKFIENKDLTTKRTSFTGKWAKYSSALKDWVTTSPKWINGDNSAYLTYKGENIQVNWTEKTITISKDGWMTVHYADKAESQIRPRTMEYCVDAPTTYGDATMRHS